MGLRITNWNVNGIRNPFGYQPWRESRTFQAMFDILEADIVIMQETKIQRKDLRDDMVLVPGWDVFFSLPRHKKGYSGVAIYTRNSVCCPIRAEEGITGVLCPPNSSTSYRDLPADQQIGGYLRPGQLAAELDELALDSEGRCVILEFPAFVLIGVYCPASRDETRTEYRLAFLDALDIRVRNLVAEGKSVVLAGDLNIMRSEMDSANLVETLRKEGITVDEFFSMPARRMLNHLVFQGRVIGGRDEGRESPVLWDLCRMFHPDRRGMFTCWDTKKNARPGNCGSRIDYVLCSDDIKPWFTSADIQEGLLGSDHCPVYAVLAEKVTKDGKEVDIRDLMNPATLFKDGNRLREWAPTDLLPLSAKLIPEFDRRQSIRDMFFKKAPPKQKESVPEDNRTSIGEAANSETADDEPERSTALSKVKDTTSETEISDPASSIQASTQTPSSKRPIAAATVTARPLKKSKGATTKEVPAKSTQGMSQKSLAGFFKPTSSTASPGKARPLSPRAAELPLGDPKGLRKPEDSDVLVLNDQKEPWTPTKDTTLSSSTMESPERIFDPIESKESWSKILKKRVVPRCEHNEPCISYVTKKPGVNNGRSFFICPRPLGPSGEKERGTEWRCATFIWSSDWKAERDPQP